MFSYMPFLYNRTFQLDKAPFLWLAPVLSFFLMTITPRSVADNFMLYFSKNSFAVFGGTVRSRLIITPAHYKYFGEIDKLLQTMGCWNQYSKKTFLRSWLFLITFIIKINKENFTDFCNKDSQVNGTDIKKNKNLF